MISVEEAREKILGYVNPLPVETRLILEALGQVLGEDVYSTIDIPPLDNSAMDGYAVRVQDTTGASDQAPKILTIIGEIAAGYVSDLVVTDGTAIRIMTGAPVPGGADAVVRFEDTDEMAQKSAGETAHKLSKVAIFQEAVPGLNIRAAGEDVRVGQLVLEKGRVLRPAEIGVLASLGRAGVKVIRRPIVAILSTGDELVKAGEPLPPGKIYDSNTYSVASLVQRYGGIPMVLGIARDNLDALERSIEESLGADMLITSAGVSMGDFDIVKDVLAAHGQISFWTVQMKPGKPLAFGLLRSPDGTRQVPHLGLPGNPVSSMITFEQFARPAILKMLGKTRLEKPTVEAILDDSVVNRDGRRYYARAIVEIREGRYHARLTGPQGSGILTSMVAANGLVVLPEDTKQAKPGELVQVQMLDWPEEVDQPNAH
ncbi:MAG: molybdopterin molybdotransferase MoeA [Dehalococcoidia bacterium]|nr:molybdopterin molybdotransferase MoeA [Dehalococcoidia bacterium]